MQWTDKSRHFMTIYVWPQDPRINVLSLKHPLHLVPSYATDRLCLYTTRKKACSTYKFIIYVGLFWIQIPVQTHCYQLCNSYIYI